VKYLIDALAAVDAPQIALETTAPQRPGVIRAIGDESFLHLIMPMHLPRS
jgi:DNA polymerase-3 subunit beta